jgi:hypothetical protein
LASSIFVVQRFNRFHHGFHRGFHRGFVHGSGRHGFGHGLPPPCGGGWAAAAPPATTGSRSMSVQSIGMPVRREEDFRLLRGGAATSTM